MRWRELQKRRERGRRASRRGARVEPGQVYREPGRHRDYHWIALRLDDRGRWRVRLSNGPGQRREIVGTYREEDLLGLERIC